MNLQERMNTIPRRKPVVLLDMQDDPELFDLINQYKRTLGWTWKRFWLIGIADAIIKQGDNPEIALKIADYLEGRR